MDMQGLSGDYPETLSRDFIQRLSGGYLETIFRDYSEAIKRLSKGYPNFGFQISFSEIFSPQALREPVAGQCGVVRTRR